MNGYETIVYRGPKGEFIHVSAKIEDKITANGYKYKEASTRNGKLFQWSKTTGWTPVK
jgi:hypothetical protein